MWLLNPYWYTRQYSAPVSDYLDRVIAADVAAGNLLGLEDDTKSAYNTFIDSLVVDGYLGVSGGTISQASSVIKAAPIMAGARTLAGALVPLVGGAPTRFGTESGWNYNRRTGVLANGTNNYLSSNRSNSADPQNSNHNAVYVTSLGAASGSFIGAEGAAGATNFIGGGQVNAIFTRSRSSVGASSGVIPLPGLIGHSRATSTSYTVRVNQTDIPTSVTSSAPETSAVLVFRRGSTSNPAYTAHRTAFYSIGGSLNLALLEVRLTALINAFAAIP